MHRKDFDVEAHYREGDGWKMHLSIDDRDIGRAWDEVIAPILMEARVDVAKLADGQTLRNFSLPAHPQAGKIVTLYTPGTVSWNELAFRLELALAENGIRPGPPINDDRPIPGSRYIGYRNERALRRLARYGEDGYLSSKTIRELIASGDVPADLAYNPSYCHDPLRSISFVLNRTVSKAHAILDGSCGIEPLLRILDWVGAVQGHKEGGGRSRP